MKKKEKDVLYRKCVDVIVSCESLEQFVVAEEYCKLAKNRMNDPVESAWINIHIKVQKILLKSLILRS